MPQKAKTLAADDQPANKQTKLDQLTALMRRAEGASVAEMAAAIGWQPHSVRGALAGALKKRGLAATSEKIEGVRRYRLAAA